VHDETDWLPSAPLVTGDASVHVVPSFEIWILKVAARAVSQWRSTPQTCCAEPRSTCTHCGSEAAELQRVPSLPSVAAVAGVPAFSVDEAVVGWPWALLPVEHDVGADPPKTWNSQIE
jgi:hypothetical protein